MPRFYLVNQTPNLCGLIKFFACNLVIHAQTYACVQANTLKSGQNFTDGNKTLILKTPGKQDFLLILKAET